MTQRDQGHPIGTFPTCPRCAMEPHHILDSRRRPMGGHLMQCACGETGKFDNLDEALQTWCVINGIVLQRKELPPRGVVRQLHARARP